MIPMASCHRSRRFVSFLRGGYLSVLVLVLCGSYCLESARSSPPPSLIRYPYRRVSGETLKLPNSVSPGVESDSIEHVEKESEAIAESVSAQIQSQNRGRVILALTEFTHPESRKADPMVKRIEDAEAEVDRDLALEQLKQQKIVQKVSVYSQVGLVIIDFDPSVDSKTIQETVKHFWHTHPGVWMIEADSEVDMREVNEWQNATFRGVRGLESDVGVFPSTSASDSSNHIAEVPPVEAERSQDINSDTPSGTSVFPTFNGEITPLSKATDYQNQMDISLPPQVSQLEALFKSLLMPHADTPGTMSGKTNPGDDKVQVTQATRTEEMFDDPKTSAARESALQGMYPDDSLFSQQWALHNRRYPSLDIRATEAWRLLYPSNPAVSPIKRRDVVVAHIDTGVDLEHPDLKSNIWWNPNEIPGNGIDDDGNGFIDDVHGWNFLEDNNDVTDKQGHGTHTAGILGAVGNNGHGVAGVIWEVKLMILKFRNDVSDAVGAIDYSIQQGAKVSTNSWGFNTDTKALQLALLKTEQFGQLFVCAVDNKGRDNTWFKDYPPNYNLSNMISVANVNGRADLDTTSDYGADNVDIAAPGKHIISTVPNKVFGEYYGFKDGTSMAAPLVAGLAALLMSVEPTLTNYEAKDIIMRTVTPLTAIKDRIRAGGIVNAENAVKDVLGIPYEPAAEIRPVEMPSSSYPDIFLNMGRASELLFSGFNNLVGSLLRA